MAQDEEEAERCSGLGRANLLERFLAGLSGRLVVDSTPLGSDPDLLSRKTRSSDRLAGLDLVPVCRTKRRPNVSAYAWSSSEKCRIDVQL